MKICHLLMGLPLFAGLAFCADEIAPPTLPSRPTKGYVGQHDAGMDGFETRAFRVGGKEYIAVLMRRDIAAGPEWRPASDLPINLAKTEEIARDELRKFGADPADWETSGIQLNRLEESTESKWYYAVSFSPVLKVRSLPSESMVVLLTLDGKPGHTYFHKARQ